MNPFTALWAGTGTLFASFLAFLGMVGGKLILALLIFLVGRYMIRKLTHLVQKTKLYTTMDPTVRVFMKNAMEIALYMMLAISVISVLGVPMASVITVLASAGVAIGLSLQGALSNLAGGIMLLIFRPFNVGDYVSAAGAEGTVHGITLIYTILITLDNKRITVPNGSLMNANVVNFSSEPLRRVDMDFRLRYGSDPEKVNALIRRVLNENPRILKSPEFFAGLTASTENAMVFTARGWVNSEDYWPVYSEMIEGIAAALREAGFQQPSVQVKMNPAEQ